MTNKPLKLSVTNAFGLMSKLDEFRHVLHAESPDFAIVTESKLAQAVTQAELTFPGYYQPLRRDRNRHGGGVAVWVKATVAMNELDTIDVFGQELVQSTSLITTLGGASKMCPYSRSVVIPEVLLYVLQLEGTLLWAWKFCRYSRIVVISAVVISEVDCMAKRQTVNWQACG